MLTSASSCWKASEVKLTPDVSEDF